MNLQNYVGVVYFKYLFDSESTRLLFYGHTYNYNAAYPLPLFNISNNHHYINENVVLDDEYFIE